MTVFNATTRHPLTARAFGAPGAPEQGAVMGRSLMAVTAHPAVTETALATMRAGGNAFDATVAASFLLTVLKPARCGLGGDAFFLVYSAAERKVTAYNGSGAAPAGATPAAYAGGVPERGIRSVAVPGYVDAVLTLHRQVGSLPLAQLMAPAIEQARSGFPVSLRLSQLIEQFRPLLEQHPASAGTYLAAGGAPAPGTIQRQPELAAVLQEVLDGGADAFYRGRFARALVEVSERLGGHFTAADLASHGTEMGEPIAVSYRGLRVLGQPPVSQGHILLEALGILDGFELDRLAWDDPARVHLMIEAKKLCFADRSRHAGDPRRSGFNADALLSPAFLSRRRAAIDLQRAAAAAAAGTIEPVQHDTTSFAVMDGEGNAIAAIQSVFAPWGSGVVVDGTGVLMNNRLTGFTLEPGHANQLEPGRRPVHTLNNFMVMHDNRPLLFGGTPGGQQQVQTNLQLISAILDSGIELQAANDLPRWGHTSGLEVALEGRFGHGLDVALTQLGHRPERVPSWDQSMGRACLIGVHESGARMGTADLRSEGTAAGW